MIESNNEINSIVPVYILMLLVSVALVCFNLGRRYEDNNTRKVEYRFLPRTQEEMEKHISATESLSSFV
jgi:hypothetical protein